MLGLSPIVEKSCHSLSFDPVTSKLLAFFLVSSRSFSVQLAVVNSLVAIASPASLRGFSQRDGSSLRALTNLFDLLFHGMKFAVSRINGFNFFDQI
jgi:hypothetical protein